MATEPLRHAQQNSFHSEWGATHGPNNTAVPSILNNAASANIVQNCFTANVIYHQPVRFDDQHSRPRYRYRGDRAFTLVGILLSCWLPHGLSMSEPFSVFGVRHGQKFRDRAFGHRFPPTPAVSNWHSSPVDAAFQQEVDERVQREWKGSDFLQDAETPNRRPSSVQCEETWNYWSHHNDTEPIHNSAEPAFISAATFLLE